MVADRFVEKVRRDRRRRWWRIGLAVLVLVLLVGGAWLLWAGPVLEVDEVRVTGARHLDAEDVLEAAEVPLGTPAFQVDTQGITDRVAELLPVASVRVHRDLPRTIRIAIEERQAVAWVLRGTTPWAVDAEGVVYRSLRSRPDHLPQLRANLSDDETREATARVAADLAAADSSVLAQVRVIRARTKDSVELDLSEGRLVVWGSADEAEHKVATLAALLQIEARRYDVSAPERPTTRN